jgi:hypothetical protein
MTLRPVTSPLVHPGRHRVETRSSRLLMPILSRSEIYPPDWVSVPPLPYLLDVTSESKLTPQEFLPFDLVPRPNLAPGRSNALRIRPIPQTIISQPIHRSQGKERKGAIRTV